jgi:hypothetical protein
MKKLLTLIATVFISIQIFAQAPQKMSYQAVIRNASNNLVTNAPVKMRISILQGNNPGTSVYSELHSATTNANGLVSIEIGEGTNKTGTFSSINWGNGTYFLKTETDPTNGSTYSIVGTSQLLSVPYALESKNAESANNGIKGISDNGDTLFLMTGQKFTKANNSGSGNLVLPTITTKDITGITSNSATFGGTVINSNGSQIMERGILYSTSPNPTINSNRIIIGSGTGAFDTISALGYGYPHLFNPGTTYYVRAYAITENNISAYGNEVSFTTLSVGQAGPGGGIIFFDKGNTNGGWQFLEVAPNDQSTGINWGCSGTSINGTKLTVGSGEENTALIVAGCQDANFAAKLCNDLILGGQNDWFLPSRDELNLICKNVYTATATNLNLSFASYLSSSGVDASKTWIYSFVSCLSLASSKNESNPPRSVRAIRAY